MEPIQLVECPRDAMQGIKTWIPTAHKVRYLQSLLAVGFHSLDFGSFVSPKAIPQMADTQAVLEGLDLSNTQTKLLAIVANLRGAEIACQYKSIDFVGYPFSISENFQMRNTHKTIQESLIILDQIATMLCRHNKTLVVYLSMGFGNPYGDPWNVEIVEQWVDKLVSKGIQILSLSDTVGTAKVDDIRTLFSTLVPSYPKITFGAHLHTHPKAWHPKLEAAYLGGCRRFDGAIQGFGGCPMAADRLVGNMPTEKLITFFRKENESLPLNPLHFEAAYNKAIDLFSNFS